MADQVKEEGAPAKNNKKLFIIIGAAAAVVVIAVVAVLMLTGGKKGDKAAEGQGEAKTEKAAGGHGGGGKEGEKGAAPIVSVYPMEPFIVNIYDGQELRYLKLKVELEMSGAGVKPEVEARQAQLRDAILVLLTTKTMQEVQDLQGKNQLRDEILAATGKILAPGKITKVFFTDFVVQ
jgi:flagellar FliL protein